MVNKPHIVVPRGMSLSGASNRGGATDICSWSSVTCKKHAVNDFHMEPTLDKASEGYDSQQFTD